MFDSQFLNHMYKIGSHYIENGSQIAMRTLNSNPGIYKQHQDKINEYLSNC